MLESLINFNFNAGLSLLLLRTISGNDPLGLGEVGPDGLRKQNASVSVQMGVAGPSYLSREVFKWSSLDSIDGEFVVGVDCGETSRNLIRTHGPN